MAPDVQRASSLATRRRPASWPWPRSSIRRSLASAHPSPRVQTRRPQPALASSVGAPAPWRRAARRPSSTSLAPSTRSSPVSARRAPAGRSRGDEHGAGVESVIGPVKLGGVLVALRVVDGDVELARSPFEVRARVVHERWHVGERVLFAGRVLVGVLGDRVPLAVVTRVGGE
jgi:hypothetical protein